MTCQDIREADKITKINAELDDVKEVLQRSIDQVIDAPTLWERSALSLFAGLAKRGEVR